MNNIEKNDKQKKTNVESNQHKPKTSIDPGVYFERLASVVELREENDQQVSQYLSIGSNRKSKLAELGTRNLPSNIYEKPDDQNIVPALAKIDHIPKQDSINVGNDENLDRFKPIFSDQD